MAIINLFDDNACIINAKKYHNAHKITIPFNTWIRQYGCNKIIEGYVVYRFYSKKKYNWFVLKWG